MRGFYKELLPDDISLITLALNAYVLGSTPQQQEKIRELMNYLNKSPFKKE